MPVMPYIVIPGLPFLRDITYWISQYIIHYKPYIRSYTNKDLMIQFLIQFKQRNNVTITIAWVKLHLQGHRQCLRWEMILVVVTFLRSVILVLLFIVWP